MKINSRKGRTILTCILAAGILLAFVYFSHGNAARIESQNEEYLYELTIQRASSISSLIDNNITFIRSTAYLYGETMKDGEVDLGLLRQFEDNSAFEALRFVDSKGRDYTVDGIKANLADQYFFKEGMLGHSGVDFISRSRVTGGRQIIFYAPVYKGNEVNGVMVGVFGEVGIHEMIDYDLFGADGESWLCDTSGFVIGSTREEFYDDYFKYLADEGECGEKEINNIRKMFSAGGGAAFTYMTDGNATRAYASGIENSDWVLIRSFPPSAVSSILSKANRNGLYLILSLVLLFASYVLVMSIGYSKEQEKLNEDRRNAEYIARAMASLFEKIIRVDLKTGKYDYAVGAPNDTGLDEKGDYREYCSSLLSQISDADNYRTVAEFIRIDNLRKIMKIQDVAVINIRTNYSGHDEVFSYKYAVTRREDGEPTEIFIIAQDVTNMISETNS